MTEKEKILAGHIYSAVKPGLLGLPLILHVLYLAVISACGPMAWTPRQDAQTQASDSTLVIHPHEYELADVRGLTTIFLVGTIDNGNSEDWQQTVAWKLAGKDRKYILYNPRQQW